MINFTELSGRGACQSRGQEVADELHRPYFHKKLKKWFRPGYMGEEFEAKGGDQMWNT